MEYTIDNLLYDIEQRQSRLKSVHNFIADRHLQLYRLGPQIIETLPAELYFGSVFLIKNNTIIEISTMPVEESRHYAISGLELTVKSEVFLHNLDRTDIDVFKNPDIFDSIDGMTSTNAESTEKFIAELIRAKFNIYTQAR